MKATDLKLNKQEIRENDSEFILKMNARSLSKMALLEVRNVLQKPFFFKKNYVSYVGNVYYLFEATTSKKHFAKLFQDDKGKVTLTINK